VIKKIFSTQSHTITGAAIILGGASFLSRLIGLLRDRLFAHYFGAGDILDAYYAAFRIPDFLFNILLAGAITAGFIPIFWELWQKNKNDAWRLTNNILILTGVLMALGSMVAFICAPQLTKMLTPGFSAEKLALTTQLTRIMLLSPILLGLSGVISSVLHSFRQFVAFSLAPLIYNSAIILGTIFLVPILGPIGLAWGVVMGALLHLLIQLPAAISQGYYFHWIFNLKDSATRSVIKLVIPRTLAMVALQTNFLVLTIMASTLAIGSIAVFNLAQNLYYVPIGLIGQSFALAAFPIFAKAVVEKNDDELVRHFGNVVRQILFLIIPGTILLILFRAQIVRVVLGSGKFNWTDTILTSDTLALLAISLTAHCIMLITARALYAYKDAWSTVWAGLIGVAITVFLSIFLKNYWGIRGLGLALSASIIIQTALLWVVLRRRVNNLEEGKIMTALAKISLGSVVLGIVAQITKYGVAGVVDMTRWWGILSQGLICGTVGILAYGFVCHILKLEEMELFKESFKKRWLKIWHVTE